MQKNRVNLLLIIITIILIASISTLIYLESTNYYKFKDKSQSNFNYLEDKLMESNITDFIYQLKNYYKIMPELLTLRLSDNSKDFIYLFSIHGNENLPRTMDYFDRPNTIFNVFYSNTLKLSNSDYTLQAEYSVHSKNNFYTLLRNISISLVLYLFIIFCLLIYAESNKSEHILKNKDSTIIKRDNYNKDYLPVEQKISNELKKSASFDQDLVLILVGSSDNLIKKNEQDFLNILNKYFPFNDLIFRYDENTFGILLPNLDLEKGIQQIEKFDQTFVSSSINTLKFPVMFGLSSRNGRLISGNIILKEAKAALNKARSDKDFPIIGFRPNPARYREYLSKLKKNNI
jgi:hypothetical protein